MRIKSRTTRIEAVLDEKALPALLELLQKHQLSGEEVGERFGFGRGRRPRGPSCSEDSQVELSDESRETRKRLVGMELETFWSCLEEEPYPIKVTGLIAWGQARKKGPIKRRGLTRLFGAVGDHPSNLGRDVHRAMKEGWVIKKMREFPILCLTNAGWTRVREMLDEHFGDDNDAVVV